MSVRTATAPKSPQKVQRELEDLQLVLKARNGSSVALDQLIRRYTSFVRLKASSYFLAGGDSEDLIQEGLVGLYKAVRDFRPDKETSFRSFAELCVTRQIITAIKTATRFKHAPLNSYVSFSHTPAGQEGDDCTLGDALPGPAVNDPSVRVISTQELECARRLPVDDALAARGRRAAAVPRRLVVRADGGGPRLRHEDDRQRAAAGEAEDPDAPAGAPGAAVDAGVRCPAAARAGVAQLVEQGSCKAQARGSSPLSGSVQAFSSACSRSAQSSSTSSSPTDSRSSPTGMRSPSQRWRLSIVERTPPRLVALRISVVAVSTARGSATSNEISPQKPG